MKVSRYLPLLAIFSLIPVLASPSTALAGAVYYCNGGGCTGDGGNGDNGTNNGNNSSDNTNTVNVNLPSGYGSQAGGSGSGTNNFAVPIQLPSFAASGCGSRPTVYGGVTGTPGNGVAFGNSANFGFGVGFLTAIGKEPDSCKPPVVGYYPGMAVAPGPGPAMRPAMASDSAVVYASAPQVAAAPSSGQAGCVPLDFDVAQFYAHDLRVAKHTLNTVRIERDMNVLERGCYHLLVIDAIAGH